MITLIIILGLHSVRTSAQTVTPTTSRSEIEVLSKLLYTFYPQLRSDTLEGALEVTLEGGRLFARDIKLHPCIPSGSVSAPRIVISPTTPANKPAEPARPKCGSQPPSEFADYLNIHFDLGTSTKRYVTVFFVSGTFVDGQLVAVRNQFKGNLNPTEAQALEALNHEHPNYGPGNRGAFLASIPVAEVQKVTGCKLNTESAVFSSGVGTNSLPDLQWHVTGKMRRKTRASRACLASFEPFNGRLTALTQ